MLGGERQVGLVNDLSYTPTLGQTFSAAKAESLEQVKLLSGYIIPGLRTEEQQQKSAAHLQTIDELLNDPRQGFGQQALNSVGSVIGSLLPTLPLAVATGGVGAGVSGVIGFGARKLALELGTEAALTGYLGTQVPLKTLASGTLSHFLPKASIGAIGAGITEAYAGYKGFIIPEHFAEHYNAVNNTLDTGHAIEDWASDNYGFLLGAAPLAAGYVAFKGIRGIILRRNAITESKAVDAELSRLFREHEEVLKENIIVEGQNVQKQARVSELQSHLQQAEDEGLISPEMHEWYLDYLENPNDKGKVHEGGLKVLEALQIPYDRVTGRVWNQVLSRDGIKNLQSAMFDESITNLSAEENQLLSSYIIHNELDGYVGNMRENPNLLNAMQGFTDNIGRKIASHSEALKNFESALTRTLPKGLMKRELFSQKNIFEHLKKIGVSHTRDIPYHVPKVVRDKIKILNKIRLIEARRSKKYERLFKEGRHIDLKHQLKEDFLTPREEIISLQNELMQNGELIHNYKNSEPFYRLQDLSQVWPNAKVLLDRINMEASNAKQKGLNEILKKFTEMVDVNASRLANPDAVKRYLHSRIERAVPLAREFEQLGINVESNALEIETVMKESSKPEVLFDEVSMEKVNSSEFAFAKEQFVATEKRYKQFSENEKALNDLIKCALGG